MNEPENIKRAPRTHRYEGRTTKRLGEEILRKKDLLNYFKKLERAFQRENNSEDEEGYKSSSDSDRSVGLERIAIELPSWTRNDGKRSNKVDKRRKEFCEALDSIKDSQNRDYRRANFRAPFELSRQHPTGIASKRQSRNFQISESWSEGNVGRLRNEDSENRRRRTNRKGSSVPFFTAGRKDFVRPLSVYPGCKCDLANVCDPRIFEANDKRASGRKSNGRCERAVAGDVFQLPPLFPIVDDLNSLEILRCEELLKSERKREHRCRLELNCREKTESKGKSKFRAATSTSTYRTFQSSSYKQSERATRNNTCSFRCETKLPLFESDCRCSGIKNRRSFACGNDADGVNTLTDKRTVTCKNNAGAWYERKQEEEEEEEELCKLINTCRDRKRFGSFHGTMPEAKKTLAVKRCSEYRLCPENVDTRRPQHHSWNRRRWSVVDEKNLDSGNCWITNEKNDHRRVAESLRKNRKKGDQPPFLPGLNSKLRANREDSPTYRNDIEETYAGYTSFVNQVDSCSCIETSRGIRDPMPRSESSATCCCSHTGHDSQDEVSVRKSRPWTATATATATATGRNAGSSNSLPRVDSSKSTSPRFSRQTVATRWKNYQVGRCGCCNDCCPLERVDKLEKSQVSNETSASKEKSINLNVRVAKPKDARRKINLNKVFIYPPRGETGPPLTLYKTASNINCIVKRNTRTGFRYDVTYVQKFASPAWCPEEGVRNFLRRTANGCDRFSDYG